MGIPSPLSAGRREILLVSFLFLISFSMNFYGWNALSLLDDRSNVHLLQSLFHGDMEMIDGYIGVIFFMVLTGMLFGVNQFSVRLAVALCIGMTVVLTYLFARDYLGRKEGLLACLILLVFSSFILSKMSDVPYLAFFPILILFLFYRYRKTGNNLYLYAGAFVSGYSLYHKLLNLYTLLAILFSLILIRILFRRKLCIIPPKRMLCISVIIFFMGMLPLIIYNVNNNFLTCSMIISHVYKTEYPYNHENLNIMENIKRRAELFPPFISEDVSFFGQHNLIRFPKRGYNFNLLLFLTCLSILSISKRTKYVFLVLLFLIFSFLMTFVPTVMTEMHYFTVYPLIAIIISGGLMRMAYFRRPYTLGVFLLLMIIMVALNLPTILNGMYLMSNQKLIEKFLPTKASVHQRFTESLKDEQLVVIPNSMFFELLMTVYPYNNVSEFCDVKYYEKNNTCYFLSCDGEKLFMHIESVKYAFNLPVENVTGFGITIDEGCVYPGGVCMIDHCENHNYPFEFFINQSRERGFETKLEREFINAHGKPVYRVYSLKKSK